MDVTILKLHANILLNYFERLHIWSFVLIAAIGKQKQNLDDYYNYASVFISISNVLYRIILFSINLWYKLLLWFNRLLITFWYQGYKVNQYKNNEFYDFENKFCNILAVAFFDEIC